MKSLVNWVLSLFKKPEEEFTAWPFPAPVMAQRKRAAKKTVKKPATKKTVAKKTTKKKVAK